MISALARRRRSTPGPGVLDEVGVHGVLAGRAVAGDVARAAVDEVGALDARPGGGTSDPPDAHAGAARGSTSMPIMRADRRSGGRRRRRRGRSGRVGAVGEARHRTVRRRPVERLDGRAEVRIRRRRRRRARRRGSAARSGRCMPTVAGRSGPPVRDVAGRAASRVPSGGARSRASRTGTRARGPASHTPRSRSTRRALPCSVMPEPSAVISGLASKTSTATPARASRMASGGAGGAAADDRGRCGLRSWRPPFVGAST